jgi:peptidoglycan/LPS O-acetylase OafA/YrhL
MKRSAKLQVRRGTVTIKMRQEETGGRATGFDYLRIILAVAVVFWHSFTTAYGNGFAYGFLTTPWRPFVAVIVPMFFALSGFLVAGSLFRNSKSTFIGLRVIRIVPALSVETLLSAIILGPMLTKFGLHAYFTSPILFKYLGNITGWIHYQLPGLFLTNPVANRVNGQLWTVPWELWCYALLLLSALTRVVRIRTLFAAAVIFGTIGLFVYEVIAHGQMDQENGVAPPALLMGFLSAVVIYLYRDKLPWSGWLAVTSTVVMAALFWMPGGDYLIGFPAAYTTVYLGLLNPPKSWGADYSYGLYIYHYVIQQALVFLLPASRHWYIVFPVSFVLTAIFAAGSWHLVEQPALKRKDLLPYIERFFARLNLMVRRRPPVAV